MDRILIIQTAFLGDVILATALAETLHQLYPNARIDMLVKKQNASLLNNHPFLNKILVFDKTKVKMDALFDLLREIRKEKYDAVINAHRFFSSGFLTAFSGAAVRSGFSKNPFSGLFTHKAVHSMGGEHETERNLKLLAFTGINKTLMPALYPHESDVQFVSKYQTDPYICIAPASVWYTKQYPAVRWVELILKFPQHLKIYLLGSEQDEQLCNEIASKSKHSQLEILCGKLSLLQTAALMKKSIMNYVNDSAPLHITSAMNAPVTAIFCSTVPSFGFGPLSTDAMIVETNDSELQCRPCGLHGHKKCPEKHFECAYRIDNNVLAQRTLSKLNKT